MRHAVPFAQLLDEAVAAATVASSLPRSTPPTAFPRAVGFFEFTVGGQPVPRIVPHSRSTYQIMADPARPPSSARPTQPRFTKPSVGNDGGPVTRRVTGAGTRRLTLVERKAVDEMVSLGASLDADFTADELRGAYRQLARRYHPDLHPACSEREKARLSALFTRAHASYQILLERHAPA